MMIDGQAHGKGVEVAFTDAPATNEEIWRQYVVASYLLGNNGRAWMAFSSASKHPYTDPSPLYKLPIGSPAQTASSVSGYQIRPGVFLRRFTSGVAIVNLSGSSTTVSLGGTYRDVAGKTYSGVTLASARGIVLQQVGAADGPTRRIWGAIVRRSCWNFHNCFLNMLGPRSR